MSKDHREEFNATTTTISTGTSLSGSDDGLEYSIKNQTHTGYSDTQLEEVAGDVSVVIEVFCEIM